MAIHPHLPFDDPPTPQDPLTALVERYRHLTQAVMPLLARGERSDWPVRNDHCFQRIVLDTVCGGVWYDHLARPAHSHLNADQAQRAVELCEAIIAGDVDLAQLNRQSLAWRGKVRTAGPK